MGAVNVLKFKTTYLQMLARPERVVPPPREGLAVVHAQRPTVADYRSLYDAVGRDYDWTSRRKLSDAELAALLHDPRLEVHVLMAEGVPAGFAELDRRIDGEIELVQFGLMPEFIGLGAVFPPVDHRQGVELRPQALLAAHLHQGPPGGPAQLPEGGLRRLQGRGQGPGVTRCPPVHRTSRSGSPRPSGRSWPKSFPCLPTG